MVRLTLYLMGHCVNLGGFNCPSQKWFNIVYLDEERPPQKFWSHTTIFSLEKLSFSHFLGHENLIWGDIINCTTYVGYFDGDWPPWKFWSHTTIILIEPTSFFDWFYNFLVMRTLLEVRSWIAQPTSGTLMTIWKFCSHMTFFHKANLIFSHNSNLRGFNVHQSEKFDQKNEWGPMKKWS